MQTDPTVPPASPPTDQERPGPALPTITLPQGGGAIRGLGEKFSVNPVTGTSSITVPLTLSPGRSGFTPTLSLSYDSGSGNGAFGLGWSVALPSISRKTQKILPRYRDEEDIFLLSNAEDLVPAGDAFSTQNYRVQRYRPRIEGLFARIERWTRADGDVHWRSTTGDNVTTLYGFSPAARDGGALLKKAASANIQTWIADQTEIPELRLFSAKHDFPNDWHRFLNPTDQTTDQVLNLGITQDRFPFLFRAKEIDFMKADIFLKLKPGFSYKDNTGKNLLFDLKKEGGSSFTGNELKVGGSPVENLPYATKLLQETPGAWTITVKEADLQTLHASNAALLQTVTINNTQIKRLNPAAIEDLVVVFHYAVNNI